MNLLLLSVPLLPLLASLIAMLLPKHSRGGALPVIMATATALAVLLLLHGEQPVLQASWFETGQRTLSVGLALNDLTWCVAVVVAGIALMVAVYSAGYMAEEPQRQRFFAELSLFIGAMLTLVLANSLVLLFAAWEVVGIASYLLIGYHYHEQAARQAAAKAFLMTRIGDMGFLIAWLLVFTRLGTTDIDVLLKLASDNLLPPAFATFLSLLFLAAVAGKSAQLPFSMWLPEAMVAPTPASALLHSATMVAAGVYLLLRLYPLLAAAPGALDVVFWLGVTTAAIAALLAAAQMDLKLILAWSTISQLGEMLLAIGLQAPLAAALHLIAHACFKSTLFMAAGNIDRYAGTRDLREISGLWRVLPLTTICLAIGAFSLSGIQPLFNETSHDAIFSAAAAAGVPQAFAALMLLLFAGIYSGRAGAAILAGPLRAPTHQPGDLRPTMQVGLAAAALASALIPLTIKALRPVLPFNSISDTSLSMHLIALTAGGGGLIIGIVVTLRNGPVLRITDGLALLQKPLAAVVHITVQLIERLAAIIPALEHGLDAAARKISGVLQMAAGGCCDGDQLSGVLVIEQRLEHLGSRLASVLRQTIAFTERIEHDSFGAGAEAFGQIVQAGGQRLCLLQTGKLYFYTLGLFVWVLAILVAACVVFFL